MKHPDTFRTSDVEMSATSLVPGSPVEGFTPIVRRITRTLFAALWLLGGSTWAADPDFGPNVILLDPATADAQSRVDAIFKIQERSQFRKDRYCILLKPGEYNLDILLGFYTQVAGLGLLPGDVVITGNLESNAGWFRGNATQNFWRSAENLTIIPTNGGAIKWAVSQATSFRRIHVKGGMNLSDGGWSSGGYIADCRIDGTVNSGTQQQWFTRNTDWGGWEGGNWNMVFLGVNNPPGGSWPQRPYTTIDKTPVLREKPWLAYDSGEFVVVTSELEKDVSGSTWNRKTRSVPLSEFFIARDIDNAAAINAALAQGKHLLFTPGIYRLDDTVQVTKPNTIVMGMGYATLIPEIGNAALSVADVDGVTICGLLIESGQQNSPTLVEIGPKGASADHAANPICLHDVFTRTGGFGPGQADVFVTINANDVICDHFWLWRGDHGPGAGWTSNPSKNGLIVNGNNVTCYGLFVEHCQEYQVLWNGEGGRTYFFQCEFPYDPPDQETWMAPTGARGYAAYKVSDEVKTHEAWGLGMYAFFRNRSLVVESAIEAPEVPGVKFHNACTWRGRGSAIHVLNQRSGGPGNPSRLVD